MINGKTPEPYRSCPFRMLSDILSNCMGSNCAWWDKEKQQCVIWTIAEELKNEN